MTDHYRAWPTVLVRLARVSKAELQAILQRGWDENATKKIRALRKI